MDDSKLEAKNVLPKDAVELYRQMSVVMDDLAMFARTRLNISASPETRQDMEPLLCSQCGFTALSLRISYHVDAQPLDFHGAVKGVCGVCDHETLLFCIMGQRQEGDTWRDVKDVQREELPVCTCGSRQFYPATYSLFEEDFFDEGALVAQCAICANNHLLVRFD